MVLQGDAFLGLIEAIAERFGITAQVMHGGEDAFHAGRRQRPFAVLHRHVACLLVAEVSLLARMPVRTLMAMLMLARSLWVRSWKLESVSEPWKGRPKGLVGECSVRTFEQNVPVSLLIAMTNSV